VRQETWVLEGHVDPAALVIVEAETAEARTRLLEAERNGVWTVEVPLSFGRTVLHVTATAGGAGEASTHATVEVVREGAATMQVFFRGETERIDRDEAVWFDPSTLASAPAYETACDFERPQTFTLHDLLVVWSAQTDIAVDYAPCDARYGYYVDAIDGHASPGFWCVDLNGAETEVGASAVPIHPGDVVTWDDCAVPVS
jgi:hypothetical protein